MTDLLLRQVAESGAGAEGQDDFDVIGPDGLVIGRIFKADVAPVGMPWMWTMLFDYRWPTTRRRARPRWRRSQKAGGATMKRKPRKLLRGLELKMRNV